MSEEIKICSCGHPPSPHASFTTGYGVDREQMKADGRATLYLTRDEEGYLWVTNWPGSLRIKVRYVTKGRHNIAGVRFDVDFIFDGSWWHGVQYGLNTEIVHVKQTKKSTTWTADAAGGCRVSLPWFTSYK